MDKVQCYFKEFGFYSEANEEPLKLLRGGIPFGYYFRKYGLGSGWTFLTVLTV